ncbi:MAG TPA: hypothetical protein VFV50_13055 [Bdellovibrionales bacterium]|nr:hypothetical protein [Bdellovibrionales bacterium]
MKFALIALVSFVGIASAQAQASRGGTQYTLEREIYELTDEVRNLIRYEDLTVEQLTQIRDGLRDTLAGTFTGKSPLICSKATNARFYPSNRETGQVVGSAAYDAGYTTLEACRATLPGPRDVTACFKQTNGRFYPSKSLTAEVIGSAAYDAGHANFSECKATLPRKNEKVACYKQTNGRYYPSDALNGTVIGSAAYDAGYTTYPSCRAYIEQ